MVVLRGVDGESETESVLGDGSSKESKVVDGTEGGDGGVGEATDGSCTVDGGFDGVSQSWRKERRR